MLTTPSAPAGGPVPASSARSLRRRRRIPIWLKVLVAVLVAVLLYGAVTFVQVWQASRADHSRSADAIVVLGAAQYNGRPSPALRDRLEHALALYRGKVAPLIVVTGGRRQGDRFTEATAGYRWLRDRSVPDVAILKEVRGRSTWESLSAVARILRPRGMDEVVLVSSSAHAKRIGQVSSEVGLRPRVSPTGGPASLSALLRETGAVSVGRLIGYRHLEQVDR